MYRAAGMAGLIKEEAQVVSNGNGVWSFFEGSRRRAAPPA
jgi:hypothetical protein